MAKEVISTPAAPAAIGPYSQGIRIGDTVYFSGQIPLDPATGELVSGGIADQTEQVMKNMAAALQAANLTFGKVVKATIFLIDLGDFGTVNDIYGRYFPAQAPPARACVQVAALPKGAAIEIEWIAHVDG